jgi:hypothetical protein
MEARVFEDNPFFQEKVMYKKDSFEVLVNCWIDTHQN